MAFVKDKSGFKRARKRHEIELSNGQFVLVIMPPIGQLMKLADTKDGNEVDDMAALLAGIIITPAGKPMFADAADVLETLDAEQVETIIGELMELADASKTKKK